MHSADPDGEVESIDQYPPDSGARPGPPAADSRLFQKSCRSASTAATVRSPSAELVSCPGRPAAEASGPKEDTTLIGTAGTVMSIRSAASGARDGAPDCPRASTATLSLIHISEPTRRT